MSNSREAKLETISFDKLSATSMRIESIEVKKHIAELFEKMKSFQIDLEDPILHGCMKKTFESIEQSIKVSVDKLNKLVATSYDISLAKAIINNIQNSFKNEKEKFFPTPPKICKTQPHWREHNLRMQQEQLESKEISTQFYETLGKISERGKQYFNWGRIRIYAANDSTTYLSWVPNFLSKLASHLKLAYERGTVASPIMIEPITSYESLNEIDTAEFVLLIGTEALVNTRDRITTNITLSKISRRFEQDYKRKNEYSSIIPILISGDKRSSFTAEFDQRFILDFTQGASYLTYLQKLISIIYKTDESAFSDIWESFYKKLQAKFPSDFKEPLKESVVLMKGDLEIAEQQRKQQLAEASSRSVLGENLEQKSGSSPAPGDSKTVPDNLPPLTQQAINDRFSHLMLKARATFLNFSKEQKNSKNCVSQLMDGVLLYRETIDEQEYLVFGIEKDDQINLDFSLLRSKISDSLGLIARPKFTQVIGDSFPFNETATAFAREYLAN